ncbi:MAG TPA: addiction module antidote protein, HigA family [Rhodospirillales bacterium]|nr:addiction module antidote protein, HigA family [Rhodospirillales bacterium]
MRTRTHPGKLLKRELAARKLSANKLALEIRVPANRITAIINCERTVTVETALRLGVYFGAGPGLWSTMQLNHDLSIATQKMADELKRIVRATASGETPETA